MTESTVRGMEEEEYFHFYGTPIEDEEDAGPHARPDPAKTRAAPLHQQARIWSGWTGLHARLSGWVGSPCVRGDWWRPLGCTRRPGGSLRGAALATLRA